MRYYSTKRPVGPGTFPEPEGNKVLKIFDFDRPVFCEEIGRNAWGYVDYENPLTKSEADGWELIPKGVLWFPVTVSSRKHGGGLRVNCGQPIRAESRPPDTKGDTKKIQFKTRYFGTVQEAHRVMNVIQGLDITTERVRMSATQGEVRVYINGKYILNFGNRIVLPQRRVNQEDYYGDDIGGWRSSEPDSGFVLGLIWHPFDYVYHHSEKVCKALNITQEEWIEGNYWEQREKF